MKRIIKVLITSFISIIFVACGEAPRIEEGNTFNLSGDAHTFTIHTNAPIGRMSIFDYTYDENEIPQLIRPCSSSSFQCCVGEWYTVTKQEGSYSMTIEVKENITGHERRFYVSFNCGKAVCSATVIQAAK